MFRRVFQGSRSWALLAGAGAFLAAALPAQADHPYTPGYRNCPAPAYPAPIAPPAYPGLPGLPGTPTPGTPTPGTPTPGTPTPGTPTPGTPTPGTPDSSLTPRTPDAGTSGDAMSAANLGLTAPGTSIAAGGGSFSAGGGAAATGYIDNAIPISTFRVRFDAGYNNNRPDRAEFFYGKCGCFRVAGVDPSAPGPPLTETSVDYQDVTGYVEAAIDNRASVFMEVPFRFLDPQQNLNTNGLGDMNAGFKYALVACPDQYVTFQFRTYIPTGDADRGLGTNHVSLEPAFLMHQEFGRAALDTEIRDWIPISGTDFAGNIIRYGAGLSYMAVDAPNYRVIPVAEFVGWTVLDGKQTVAAGDNPDVFAIQSAAGDTILNVKLGVRLGLGERREGFISGSDLYVGYGRALTGEVWYKDMLRVEYRLTF